MRLYRNRVECLREKQGGASLGETMTAMSALGRPTEPTATGLAEFHTRKRKVHRLLRDLDRGSREAMRGFDVNGA